MLGDGLDDRERRSPHSSSSCSSSSLRRSRGPFRLASTDKRAPVWVPPVVTNVARLSAPSRCPLRGRADRSAAVAACPPRGAAELTGSTVWTGAQPASSTSPTDRSIVAAGRRRVDQPLEAQLGLVEQPLAAVLEHHALLEQRDRLLQWQIARLQLLDDGLELGQRLVEGQRGDAPALGGAGSGLPVTGTVACSVIGAESRTLSTRASSRRDAVERPDGRRLPTWSAVADDPAFVVRGRSRSRARASRTG